MFSETRYTACHYLRWYRRLLQQWLRSSVRQRPLPTTTNCNTCWAGQYQLFRYSVGAGLAKVSYLVRLAVSQSKQQCFPENARCCRCLKVRNPSRFSKKKCWYTESPLLLKRDIGIGRSIFKPIGVTKAQSRPAQWTSLELGVNILGGMMKRSSNSSSIKRYGEHLNPLQKVKILRW